MSLIEFVKSSGSSFFKRSKYSVIPVLLILIPFFSQAQNNEGINFERNTGWAGIKEKAKKENRYIFLDGYTTWCVPCKEMNKNVFTQKKVGDFFNKNFINVAVQFDVTKSDSEEVKNWYKDAKEIGKQYKIEAYPTYLFFNPEGVLVHYAVGGSSGDVFVEKAQQALNPETQYLNLKHQYENGRRDSVFVLNLINAAKTSRDNAGIVTFINGYLPTQKNMLTGQNLEFIVLATANSTDIGFNILRKYPAQIDSVAGKGMSSVLLNSIAFKEVVFPMLRTNGKITEYGGGMVVYSGDVNPKVDWIDMKNKLDITYADLSDEIIRKAKPEYYRSRNDWGNYTKSVNELFDYNKDTDMLNRSANDIFLDCDDSKFIKVALGWSKKAVSIDKGNSPWFLQTYSHLLYKSGQNEKAIKVMEEYGKISDSSDESFVEKLGKMKKGIEIW